MGISNLSKDYGGMGFSRAANVVSSLNAQAGPLKEKLYTYGTDLTESTGMKHNNSNTENSALNGTHERIAEPWCADLQRPASSLEYSERNNEKKSKNLREINRENEVKRVAKQNETMHG